MSARSSEGGVASTCVSLGEGGMTSVQINPRERGVVFMQIRTNERRHGLCARRAKIAYYLFTACQCHEIIGSFKCNLYTPDN